MAVSLSSVNSPNTHRKDFLVLEGQDDSQIILTLPCRFKRNYSYTGKDIYINTDRIFFATRGGALCFSQLFAFDVSCSLVYDPAEE